jgi:hypothetical protein
MRLTNSIRDAFVRAVMNDVPTVDYSEQAIDVLDQDVIDQLPPLVRRVWDDKKLRDFIVAQHRYFCHAGESVPYIYINDLLPRAEAKARAEVLLTAEAAQRATLEALKQKLQAVASSCTTRRALAEALPEFAKYLPAVQPTSDRSVPAVANVMTEFMRAGWPKDKAAA